MKDVKRFPVGMVAGDVDVVLASDYDRLAQECERLKRGLYDANDKAVEAWNARDAALKQVEGLRAALAEAKYRIEQGRVWAGTEYKLTGLHPIGQQKALDVIDAALSVSKENEACQKS